MVDISSRTAAAARIHAHADVAIWHPLLRIDDFPALVFVGRTRRHVRMLLSHPLPLVRIAILKSKPLPVRTVTEDDRVLPIGDRPKDIGAQDQAVIHGDRPVPVNAHAVSYFRVGLHLSILKSRGELFLPRWERIELRVTEAYRTPHPRPASARGKATLTLLIVVKCPLSCD